MKKRNVAWPPLITNFNFNFRIKIDLIINMWVGDLRGVCRVVSRGIISGVKFGLPNAN